jgi:hypothetical protein
MTPQQTFWDWFVQHEAELFAFNSEREGEREKLFDALAIELQKVDSNLTFEFGPRHRPRELIISAGGLRSTFPAVTSLVSAAPPLNRWKVTAFRPRRAFSSVVEFRGKSIDPRDVQFSLVDNGTIAGIYLFIPGFREEDADLKAIGYLLLDDALGEFDVETRLGLIKMLPQNAQFEGNRFALLELSALFDQLVSRIEGHSERPC